MLLTLLSTARRPTDPPRRVAAVLGVTALSGALLIGLLPTPVAHASLGTCGSDPVVALSNGVTIDLYATIHAASDDVQQVLYTLHAPSGTSVISVVYTSGPLGPKEGLTFYADNQLDAYGTATVVTTDTKNVAVTARTSAVPLIGLPATASAAGYDQQTLRVSVSV